MKEMIMTMKIINERQWKYENEIIMTKIMKNE